MPAPPGNVAFTIFGFEIMWYGVMIAAAIFAAVFITCLRSRRYGLTPDTVVDFSLFCVPLGLVGARLYYVAFNFGEFSDDPLRIFNTRTGGLAVHGGLLLAFLTALILSRLWDIRFLNALDLAAPSIALAQAIGRWGNWFNQEAHGGPTDLPWGTPVGGELVHPTFLYESVWCFLLFWLLLFIAEHRIFTGQILLLYCILYSLERFFVEALRTDSLMLFGTLKQAQLLSAVVFVVCGTVYVFLRRRERYRRRMFY